MKNSRVIQAIFGRSPENVTQGCHRSSSLMGQLAGASSRLRQRSLKNNFPEKMSPRSRSHERQRAGLPASAGTCRTRTPSARAGSMTCTAGPRQRLAVGPAFLFGSSQHGPAQPPARLSHSRPHSAWRNKAPGPTVKGFCFTGLANAGEA